MEYKRRGMITKIKYPVWRFYKVEGSDLKLIKSIVNSGDFLILNIGEKVQLSSYEKSHTYFLITDRIIRFDTRDDVSFGDIDYYVTFYDKGL